MIRVSYIASSFWRCANVCLCISKLGLFGCFESQFLDPSYKILRQFSVIFILYIYEFTSRKKIVKKQFEIITVLWKKINFLCLLVWIFKQHSSCSSAVLFVSELRWKQANKYRSWFLEQYLYKCVFFCYFVTFCVPVLSCHCWSKLLWLHYSLTLGLPWLVKHLLTTAAPQLMSRIQNISNKRSNLAWTW